MSLISKPYTFTAGQVIVAAEHNSNFDTLYNEINGSLTTANLSASAAIPDTKLNQITTAGKVIGAAITTLSGIPAGAGQIPVANLGTGSPTAAKALLGDGSWGVFPVAAGSVIQVVNTITGEYATGTTAIPIDNSIPQNSEGTEVMTLAITPSSATNKLRIDVTVFGSVDFDGRFTAALFQDGTAGALAAVAGQQSSSNNIGATLTFTHYMAAGTTSATTFKVRCGQDTAGHNFYFNGESGARIFGGVAASSITISEVKV